MTEQFTNDVVITLGAPCDGSVTTLTLAGGYAALPTTGTWSMLLENEILECTARTGSSLTCVRGSEGTASAPHSGGVEVIPSLTARALSQLKADAFTPGGDLAGSGTQAQWVAALAGPGGAAGPIPAANGTRLKFLGPGVPFTSQFGYITADIGSGEFPILAYDLDHGALQLGNWGVYNAAAGNNNLYLQAKHSIVGWLSDATNGTNDGGYFRIYGDITPNIATFYNDDFHVMWEQGTFGKDGRKWPIDYNSTFQTTRVPVFCLNVAQNLLYNNAVHCAEYVVGMWDFITDAPNYRWAFWKLTRSFGVVSGVVTMGVGPSNVTLIDEHPAGASTGVNPDFSLDDATNVLIKVTPPVATGMRWYAGITMPQMSDPGLDFSPNVPGGPHP